MQIKREISYYIQIVGKDREWNSIGTMGMELDQALKSWRQMKETFPNNEFRLVKKTITHEVPPIVFCEGVKQRE